MRAGRIVSAQEAPCALSNAEPFEKAAGGGQLTHDQSVTAELLPSFSVRGFAQPKERAAVRSAARMRDGRGLPPLAALFINILLPSRGQRRAGAGSHQRGGQRCPARGQCHQGWDVLQGEPALRRCLSLGTHRRGGERFFSIFWHTLVSGRRVRAINTSLSWLLNEVMSAFGKD